MQRWVTVRLNLVVGDVPRKEAAGHFREDLREAWLLGISVKLRACDPATGISLPPFICLTIYVNLQNVTLGADVGD